jgi:saccharopine dehydrogenase (NAD+, L-lysine-forming)
MTRIDPVLYNGVEIIPLQFLKAVLPEPSTLGADTKGKTCIGVIAEGITAEGKAAKGKDSRERVYVYNICDHQDAYREVGSQAISYTTGVPAMIGAKQILEGRWRRPGVWNMEEMDPDPFMDDLNRYGLPWTLQKPAVISLT